MMSQITDNMQSVILPLVPASIIHDISCFVFYDKHPRDLTCLDITICTQWGEVREYYQKNLMSSIQIDGVSNPSKIKILRNKDCILFYLIFSNDELVVLSRKEKLNIQQRLTNVERFDFNDASCSGQACLKIVLKDDAVPLIFDENVIEFRTPDMSETFTELSEDEFFPIITNLKRKLTEARYSIENNKKMLKEFMDLRQSAAFSAYKRIHPNLDDSFLKGCWNKMADALKIQSQIPWVKICNKKIIIAYIVKNNNDELLENVHTLLHGTTPPSLVYTTKIFERSHIAPYWMENKTQTIKQKTDTAIVLVIDLSEIKSNVTSAIEFQAVMFYIKSGKECFLPTDDVELSLSDLEKPEFDAMSCGEIDHYTILAILATSIKTDLLLLHIDKKEDEEQLGMFIFDRYLGMDYVLSENIVLHNKPVFSFLKSVMVVKQEEIPDGLNVTIYTRWETEVLFLLQFIRNFVPLKIITASPGYIYRMLPTHTIATDRDTDIQKSTIPMNNYLNYASSIFERSNLTLKYLDDSMVKMNESKDPAVQSKVGTEIDLLAGGVQNYLQFREEMLKKAVDGLKIAQDTIDDAFLIEVDM